MEDRVAIYDNLNMFFIEKKDSPFLNKPHALFAIFDGHSGIEAAQYVSSHLPLFIIQHELYETDIKKAIYDSFEKINYSLSIKAIAEVIIFRRIHSLTSITIFNSLLEAEQHAVYVLLEIISYMLLGVVIVKCAW
jgi:serine/threonine protein phosphatase PrpC